MAKNILIASFDMEVGGVERSLINMLENFDYDNYNVDLMLYSHTGDFMRYLRGGFNLLEEKKEYATFRKPIIQIFRRGNFHLGISRLKAKKDAIKYGKENNLKDYGYVQMQRMWQYSLEYLPTLEKEYDVAISYLWPHYFVADKVKAKKKIAWIHTDYSMIDIDVKEDIYLWNKFDSIMAVSEGCKKTFLRKYPVFYKKVEVMENIISPKTIKFMAEEKINDQYISDESFKLLTVARLSEAKGIDKAVKTLKILHNRGLKDIKWYVVGYGGDEKLIRGLIKKYKLEESFILLGKKTNPYPYMKHCDLYVQPSRYEGRAVTVTEAQILEKAVIITNYPTAKSQLRDGVDGVICEVSEKAIADELEYFYKNSNNRKKIENNCEINSYDNKEKLNILYDAL